MALVANTRTILSFGTQAKSGNSSAFDASLEVAKSFTITPVADHGVFPAPDLDVWIETSGASTGPWRVILHRRYRADQPQSHGSISNSPDRDVAGPWLNKDIAPAIDIDKFVRARWSESPTSPRDPKLQLGVTMETLS